MQKVAKIFQERVSSGGVSRAGQLARPSFLQVAFGSVVLAVKLKTSCTSAELPQVFGGCVFLHSVKRVAKNSPNLAIGVYVSAGRKYIVKRWEGRIRDLNYYGLAGEYAVNGLLRQKLSLLGRSARVRVPAAIRYEASSRSLTVMFEYIDGVSVAALPIAEQASAWARVSGALSRVSSQLDEHEKNMFGVRSKASYLLLAPAMGFLTACASPESAGSVAKSFAVQLSQARFLVGASMELSHRDLTPRNMILSGGDVYLIDCDNVAWTVSGYDFAYLSVHPGHDSLARLLAERFTTPTTSFLRRYVAIHHVLGSGAFSKVNKNFLNVLRSMDSVQPSYLQEAA